MFKNVLVGVDGRPGGRDAIALASRLIASEGKLTLAHVHGGELRPSHRISPGLVREERAASEELLEQERAAAELSAELVSIAAENAGGGLHMQAEEQNAELLVVGSTRRSTLGRAMLGDDTRAALNGAPCAVAIAAHGYSGHAAPIAKIGVAYNASPESMAAIAVARKLAAQTDAGVYALQVVAITSYAYSGIVVPDLARNDRRPREGSQRRAEGARTVWPPRRCMAWPERSWQPSAMSWTSCSWAREATGPCGGWYSAAPPTTWSATHAARCSCFRVTPTASRARRARAQRSRREQPGGKIPGRR